MLGFTYKKAGPALKQSASGEGDYQVIF